MSEFDKFMNPKGNAQTAVFGKQGGSSVPSQPGAKGSSAPVGGSVDFGVKINNDPTGSKKFEPAITAQGVSGNPLVPRDLPEGYKIPDDGKVRYKESKPGDVQSAVFGQQGGSLKATNPIPGKK